MCLGTVVEEAAHLSERGCLGTTSSSEHLGARTRAGLPWQACRGRDTPSGGAPGAVTMAVASPERARTTGLARIRETSGKPTIIREDTYMGSLPNYLYMYIAYRNTGGHSLLGPYLTQHSPDVGSRETGLSAPVKDYSGEQYLHTRRADRN